MIPTRLRISGFLSYQQPTEVDFEGLDLACISGANGAGKSSLLDAITWALFGEARTRDDEALINNFADGAEVALDFCYEENLYRVQRAKPRKKTTLLELFVQAPDGTWRALTEKSVRETENRIRQILRMDYDTFINASFFLQGRADEFAQQTPAERKAVLSNVLGLEIWETYRAEASRQRRAAEDDIAVLDGQLKEIEEELGQEQERKQRLEATEKELKQAAKAVKNKESELNTLQKLSTMLGEQKRLLDVLKQQLDETEQRCQALTEQIDSLGAERTHLAQEIADGAEIEQAYQQWQAVRDALEQWDRLAASFHEVQAKRAKPLAEISAEQARLEEERRNLQVAGSSVEKDLAKRSALETVLPELRVDLQTVEAGLQRRSERQEELQTLRQQAAAMEVENRQLVAEMKALKERLTQLEVVEGATCPLCGQPLSPADRLALIAGLEGDGKRMGDAYRANQAAQKLGVERIGVLQAELGELAQLDQQLKDLNHQYVQVEAELAHLAKSQQGWDAGGAIRLRAVEEILAREDFAAEARARLAAIDEEARGLGYDVSTHEDVRRREQNGRASEATLRDLRAAQAKIEPLARQIEGLRKQLAAVEKQRARQAGEYAAAEEKFNQEGANLPDLNAAERALLDLKEQENSLRMEVGRARQLVAVLDKQRERKERLKTERADGALRVSRLKALERAFGKDGVPALLIEQALPEIQEQADEVLDRLSAGGMSVSFETQKALKGRNKGMRETLDIRITDESGKTREYELFSGGEAFRINFAIRLALSRVLAHRAGARLQTLFIDEGFGSQDAEGRQRLLEAINQVRPEFARILVITHMEELKDAFPARIEVEKTAMGSTVSVMA